MRPRGRKTEAMALFSFSGGDHRYPKILGDGGVTASLGTGKMTRSTAHTHAAPIPFPPLVKWGCGWSFQLIVTSTTRCP